MKKITGLFMILVFMGAVFADAGMAENKKRKKRKKMTRKATAAIAVHQARAHEKNRQGGLSPEEQKKIDEARVRARSRCLNDCRSKGLRSDKCKCD